MENYSGTDYEYRGCAIHTEYSSYEDQLIFSVTILGADADDPQASAYGEAASVDEYLELVDDIIDQLEWHRSKNGPVHVERDHEDEILSELEMDSFDDDDLDNIRERINEQIHDYETFNTDHMSFRGYKIKITYDVKAQELVGTIDGVPGGVVKARSLQRIWNHSQLLIDKHLQEASKHVLNSLM